MDNVFGGLSRRPTPRSLGTYKEGLSSSGYPPRQVTFPASITLLPRIPTIPKGRPETLPLCLDPRDPPPSHILES